MDGQRQKDSLLHVATAAIGGPLGKRASAATGRSEFWLSPTLVLGIAGSVMMVLAMLLRQFCRLTNWGSPGQFTYSCYSDIPVLISTTGLADSAPPLLGGPTPGIGVGGSSLLWIIAQLSPDGPQQLAWAFDMGAVLVTLSMVLTIAAAVRWARSSPWDVAALAFSPVLVVSALVSTDFVGVMFAVWALITWRAARPVASGVLCALAMLFVATLWVVPLAIVLVSWRAGLRGLAGVTVGVTVAVFAVVQAFFAITNRVGFEATWAAQFKTDAGYGSLWFVPALGGGAVAPETVKNAWWILVTILTLAAAAWVLFHRRVVPVESVIVVILVGWFVVAPANPVQAGVWILPFAVLAVRRWSVLLPWFAAEALYATMTWQYIYTATEPNKGAPGWFYALALVLRLATLVGVALAAGVRADVDEAQLPEATSADSGSDRSSVSAA